jgi:glutathione S-transferase
MEYKKVAEARAMNGLRLALTAGVPGPWGEAAKSIFHVKGIPFIPVLQEAGADNAELVAWTGVRNAPVAMYDSEKPRDRWLDILMLAERLKPTPPLLPARSEDRAVVIGIANELCGEEGWGWSRRAMMVTKPSEGMPAPTSRIRQEYGCTDEAGLRAPQRCADILRMLKERLKAQKAAGSPYFVGSSLTAADIYWACFAALGWPLSEKLSPMPPWARAVYEETSPELDAVMDPILLEHRDFIYQRHLKLPLDF